MPLWLFSPQYTVLLGTFINHIFKQHPVTDAIVQLHGETARALKPTPWKPLPLLHFQYLDGDNVSYAAACVAVIPLVLAVAVATAVAIRRDVHATLFACGLLLNQAINEGLQQSLKQPRLRIRFDDPRGQYGMPSNGTQFMCFMAGYIMLMLKPHIFRKVDRAQAIRCPFLCILTFSALTFIVATARINLGFDTPQQSTAGAVIGIVLGCAWFDLGQLIIGHWFPKALQPEACPSACCSNAGEKRPQTVSTATSPNSPSPASLHGVSVPAGGRGLKPIVDRVLQNASAFAEIESAMNSPARSDPTPPAAGRAADKQNAVPAKTVKVVEPFLADDSERTKQKQRMAQRRATQAVRAPAPMSRTGKLGADQHLIPAARGVYRLAYNPNQVTAEFSGPSLPVRRRIRPKPQQESSQELSSSKELALVHPIMSPRTLARRAVGSR